MNLITEINNTTQEEKSKTKRETSKQSWPSISASKQQLPMSHQSDEEASYSKKENKAELDQVVVGSHQSHH